MDVDENGDLIVNHAGELNRFMEIEPGVYHNLREGSTPDAYGEFRTIVFKTDPFGHIMLTTDGPMTYSKAPWYATSSFTFLSIMMAVLIIYWEHGFLECCMDHYGRLNVKKRNIPKERLQQDGLLLYLDS